MNKNTDKKPAQAGRGKIRTWLRNPFFLCLILAFVYNLFIETLGRHAMPGYGGLYYMVHQPIVFLLNMLIIYATLCLCALFRRTGFVLTLLSSFWIMVGVANGVILMQRMTPFTMKDLASVGEGMTLLTNYFSSRQIVLMGGAILILLVFFVFFFLNGKKADKEKFQLPKRAAAVAVVIVLTLGAVTGGVKIGALSTFFGNLAFAYHDYGVPYCLLNTWLNTGISRPADYSKNAVMSIFDEDDYMSSDGTMKLSQTDTANTENKPNILFLQLESFVDPTLFTGMTYSEDPIPTYHKLEKEFTTGSLTVPACGAGTANTEFEVMTGLSVKFFGPGEYPFKTILKEKCAESLAWDLKSIGYRTHAIHNHRALFYNRNTVFDNIGYDTFTSVEYMAGKLDKTPKNWEKDNILPRQIADALDETEGRDYIYTISVQGHGKYPDSRLLTNPAIRITNEDLTAEKRNAYEYYVNQVHEMDQFVADLIEMLEERGEPTVLVMYGDHIPALGMTEDDYDAADLYQTQYIVWDNIGLEKDDHDTMAYRLAAETLDKIGIHTGTTVIFHQTKDPKSASYLPELKMLGYDMLYGNCYIYGGSNPFRPAGMRMGVKDITIDEIVEVSGVYYIKGQNFTESSTITLDGEILETVYLGPSLLQLKEKVDLNDAVKMKVSQTDSNDETILSTTE